MQYLTTMFVGNLGGWEVLIILIFALILFGRRLPDVGYSIGKGLREFKRGLSNLKEDIEKEADSPKAVGTSETSPSPADVKKSPTEPVESEKA